MSATSRMLGRFPSPGCWCCNRQKDCCEKRRRKRIEQRQVHREAEEALSDRQARTSYLMDYGPDWPPAPQAAPGTNSRRPGHEPMTLAQRCLATVVMYAVCWATAALILHAIDPHPRGPVQVVWQDHTPARSHGTDVTTTLPPHPATPARHP